MIGWVLKKILGTQNQREVRRLTPLVGEINRHEEALRTLSMEQLRGKQRPSGSGWQKESLWTSCYLRRLR